MSPPSLLHKTTLTTGGISVQLLTIKTESVITMSPFHFKQTFRDRASSKQKRSKYGHSWRGSRARRFQRQRDFAQGPWYELCSQSSPKWPIVCRVGR